jgi:STE24 endopeptidase
MSAEVTLDVTRQTQAKAYARQRRRHFFGEIALSGLVAAAWLAFGWAGALKAWLLTWAQNDWLMVAGFGVVFYLSLEIAGLPLAYSGGYRLPHQYGQSTQNLAGWVKDQALGLALAAVLGLPLLSGVYWLLRAAGDAWWLWAAGGYLLVAVVFSQLAPVLIMPLFNRYVPLGEEHAELVRRLTALAGRAGTRVAGVFRFDMSRRTRAANAALTGLGRTRRIILGDTLLNEFTPDEVEVVIAHELGHHVHRDIPLLLAFSGVTALAGLWLAAQALNWGALALGFAGPADVAAMPLLGLTLGAFSLILLPLQNAFSRWRERLADRYALEATRKPEAFVSAFIRLANQNLADVDPEPWVVFLFASHPPIRERVASARRFSLQP